jgi:hypothetical protein
VDDLGFSNLAGTEEMSSGPLLTLEPTLVESTLRLSTSQAMSETTIWDVRGNMILRERVASTNHTLDVQALPSGIYVVEVRLTDASLARQRFMKL